MKGFFRNPNLEQGLHWIIKTNIYRFPCLPYASAHYRIFVILTSQVLKTWIRLGAASLKRDWDVRHPQLWNNHASVRREEAAAAWWGWAHQWPGGAPRLVGLGGGHRLLLLHRHPGRRGLHHRGHAGQPPAGPGGRPGRGQPCGQHSGHTGHAEVTQRGMAYKLEDRY